MKFKCCDEPIAEFIFTSYHAKTRMVNGILLIVGKVKDEINYISVKIYG